MLTRPAADLGEKVRTAGCLVAIIAAAAGAAIMIRGAGPVPGVGGVIVGGFGFLMMATRIERALGPATVRFDGAAVEVARRGIFGRVRRRVEAWSVERVVVGAITAGDAKRPGATVQIRLRDGMYFGVIGTVPEEDARWVARKLASSLNMTEEPAAASSVGDSQV